jgi:hypothetical protein
MKVAAFTLALLFGGTAFAQASTDMPAPVDATNSYTTPADAMATGMASAGSQVVLPSNANPERDARGIAVISDPAIVPAGFNGTTGGAMGGPLLDAATGQPIDTPDASTRPCSRTVTDNCVQTYERGRRPS